MSVAFDMLRRAQEHGLEIVLLGSDRLRWRAKREPPSELLAELRQYKTEIIAFLSRPSAEGLTAAEATEAGRQFEIGKPSPVAASPADAGRPLCVVWQL